MKLRIARKIMKHPAMSNRQMGLLERLYPSYYNDKGICVQPSWHKYYLFVKARIIVNKKYKKYRDKFKLL